MPKLEVKFALVSTATRIPKTANGTVDIECGSSTNDVERHQQVSFLVTTFVTTSRVAWKKGSTFKSVGDLKGKTIAAAAGTNKLKEVTAVNIQRQLGMTIVPTKNHYEAFALLEKGDAAAFATGDIRRIREFQATAEIPGRPILKPGCPFREGAGAWQFT